MEYLCRVRSKLAGRIVIQIVPGPFGSCPAVLVVVVDCCTSGYARRTKISVLDVMVVFQRGMRPVAMSEMAGMHFFTLHASQTAWSFLHRHTHAIKYEKPIKGMRITS